MSKDQLKAHLVVAIGGRVAEEMIFGKDKITSGAASDIQAVTNIAKKMVTEWGMSEKLGMLRYNNDSEEVFLGHSVAQSKNLSDSTAKIIDDEVRLLAVNLVRITQALGGNYTVLINGNMVQITSENADALGFEIDTENIETTSGDIEQQIWDQLKTCYDPEIPVNIVELGLIYDLRIEEIEKGKSVEIKMTLTAPGCGMGPVIADEVDRKVNGIDGIENVSVELVWEPMWSRDMMSEEAQLELGML